LPLTDDSLHVTLNLAMVVGSGCSLQQALDDRKRAVRAEAVRAKHVWMGLA
jgi:hypothetical protein